MADAVAAPKLSVLLLALAFALLALGWRSDASRRPGWLGSLQLILALLASASALLPGHRAPRSLAPLLEIWGAAVLYLLWVGQDEAAWARQKRLICGTGLLVAVYAWVQRFGLDPLAWGHPELSRYRTIASFGNPDYLALYLTAISPIVWEQLVARPRRWGVGVLVWLAFTVKLLLTMTRSSWIAWAFSWLALGVILLMRREQRRAAGQTRVGSRWLASSLVLGVAVFGYTAWESHQPQTDMSVSARVTLSGAQAASVNVRLLLWTAGVRIAAREPWLGCGPAQFSYQALLYREKEPEALRLLARVPENAHSQYAQAFAEEGMLGGLLLLCQGLIGVVLLWRRGDAFMLAAWLGLSLNLTCLCPDVPAVILWSWLLARADEGKRVGPRLPSWGLGLMRVAILAGVGMLVVWSVQGVVYERQLWLADDDRGLAEQLQEKGTQAEAAFRMQRACDGYREAADWAPFWKASEAWERVFDATMEMLRQKRGSPPLLRSALEANARAIDLCPQDPYLYAGRARALMWLWAEQPEAFRGVLSYWVQAVGRDPYNATFHFELARFLWLAKLRDPALEEVQRSLAIVPTFKDALELRDQIRRGAVP